MPSTAGRGAGGSVSRDSTADIVHEPATHRDLGEIAVTVVGSELLLGDVGREALVACRQQRLGDDTEGFAVRDGGPVPPDPRRFAVVLDRQRPHDLVATPGDEDAVPAIRRQLAELRFDRS
jgi:hypothetical protein